jgi:glutaredoxin-related protein
MSTQLPVVPPQHPAAVQARANFHAETVHKVANLVATNDVIVIGMAWNPSCTRARNLLTERGVKHEYLEIGNYLGKWRERLAVKLWSGWPTYPQVFIKGQLVGGHTDLRALAESGELARLLA